MLSHLRLNKSRRASRPDLSRSQRQHLRSADQARDQKAWQEAAKEYQLYLTLAPADAAIWTQLGHALKESGDHAGGEAAYRTGLAFAPQDAELHLQLGHLLKMQGRFTEAEQAYTRASALNATLGAQADMTSRTEAQPAPVQEAEVGTQSAPQAPATPVDHRSQGDLARDARAWMEALVHYRAYLDHAEDDAAIWVQYGHALKEAGNPVQGEAAYRAALQIDPGNADTYLQLGHVLKLQGRRREAIEAYRTSLATAPTAWAVLELRASGYRVEFEDIPASSSQTACTYLEISDLIATMREYTTISGIQRVQLGLLNYILSRSGGGDCAAVFWGDGLLWSIGADALRRTVNLYNSASAMAQRRDLMTQALQSAVPVRPGALDTFVITGAIWMRDDAMVSHERVKRTGTRLGAYIYDFIPLTNPEYCHPYLTERFSNTIAELMLQLDFAFSISDFVGQEVQRLRSQAGCPAIPVETVKLAHMLDLAEDAPSWGGQIAELQGREFVLCVGSLAAHKNHIYALQVWRLLLERGIEPPILVFAGKLGYGVEDLTTQLRTSHYLEGRVKIIEGLDDAALTKLYKSCLFTLFPSFVEGWGLPVGESLAHGKVCFASSTTSIPEAGDGFTCAIDPYNARGAADAIAKVLLNRDELRRLEARIKAGFKPRTWNDFGSAFMAALGRVGPRNGTPLRLQPLEMLQPRPAPTEWSHGSVLPALDAFRVSALSRTAFISGWFPGEDWGRWMDGASAAITFLTDRAPGSLVRIILQLRSVFWPRRNRVALTSSGGETASAPVPLGQHDFTLQLDCAVPADGRFDLRLSLSGAVFAGGGEERQLGVGLRKLLYVALDPRSERVLPAVLIQPTALVGVAGSAAVPHGRDALIEAARRRSLLAQGWLLPEAWGTWIDGPTAQLAFRPTADRGERVRVVLRLRSSSSRPGSVVVQVAGGDPSVVALQQGDVRDLFASATGQVGQDGLLQVSLTASPAGARVGLCAATWGRLQSVEDRSAVMEAVLYGPSETASSDIELLGQDISFTVTGHMKGTYSLALVNRRLALALDAALPGRVRVEQVEGQPVADLEGLARKDQTRLSALARAAPAGIGPQVVISQHWPVWRPRSPGDLALAYVFWEESIVPKEMVHTLNTGFRGVLVPAQSVGKALIDSGVCIPVRCIGFAPDLAAFDRLAEARTSRPHTSDGQPRPFTFLHVSSCFPRKGVDVLIAAFTKAFTSRDSVRLVIKGFPNPHNDVAGQLALLRAAHADLAQIELIDMDLSEDALLDLYRAADTIVLPTRGEGFNIPAAEAMAAGIPLIVTAFGAQTEFTGDGLARWVDYRFTYSRSHLRTSNSVWAEPDVADLALAMQEAVRNVPPAGGEPGGVLALGRNRARQLGDGALWAERVRSAAAELLATANVPRPKIAWVTTWRIRCGIGEYSRMLLDKFPEAKRDVTVLCDTRTEDADLAGPGPLARKAWRRIDPSSMDDLAAAIERTGASVVVVQHHHALVRWGDLAELLQDDRVRSRRVVVTMHNTQELLEAEASAQERLVAALGNVDRVLVHTVADLNLLKQQGLVNNVSMFPHGAMTGDMPVHAARVLAPDQNVRIGAYGFFLPHKGFDRLIEAFAVVRRTYSKAMLRLVTAEYPTSESAQEIIRCRALAKSLGLEDWIEWHVQYLPNEASLKLLNGCDLLVLPYQHTPEAFSGAACCALASRVPVLVTPLPIFEELQGAVLRLRGTDVASIASGTEWLLQQDSVRRELVANAGHWLEENSWTNVAERMGGLLQGLVADGKQ